MAQLASEELAALAPGLTSVGLVGMVREEEK
jgi:hypothetical protein